ncbi:LDL receptor repeat-containing protein egg-2-like [Diadema antillarum]|uniref:LDL receptor repeat-containing protein egg-2-like n=1 Tax=Diadema antillarum TaxID=105358 RepID=UPI003A8671CB
MKADDTVAVVSPAGIDQSLHSSGSDGGIGSDSAVALGIHLMDLRWFACAVVCSLSIVQFSRASTTKDISVPDVSNPIFNSISILTDDCKVLIDMGFDVFHCTKSAYPDRDECVPRGRQADSRLRLRPGSFDPMSRVCDSRVDCTDGSDETLPECVAPHKAYCEDDLQKEVDGDYLDSFHCYGNKKNEIGSSMCVSECQMCDGRVDCPNGADELAENCSAMRRKPFGCQYF